MNNDTESTDSSWETLVKLAEVSVPEENRPRRECLASFSLAADAVRVSQRLDWEDDRELPSVLIQATPEELKAHIEVEIARAIKQQIEQGKIKRINGGEK